MFPETNGARWKCLTGIHLLRTMNIISPWTVLITSADRQTAGLLHHPIRVFYLYWKAPVYLLLAEVLLLQRVQYIFRQQLSQRLHVHLVGELRLLKDSDTESRRHINFS